MHTCGGWGVWGVWGCDVVCVEGGGVRVCRGVRWGVCRGVSVCVCVCICAGVGVHVLLFRECVCICLFLDV